jgi:hypothetical protein
VTPVWRAHCTCGWAVESPDGFAATKERDAHARLGNGHAVTSLQLVWPDDGHEEAR